jgi:general L-amino acid transport system permease protein
MSVTPPALTVSPWVWLKSRLFNNWGNSLLSLVLLPLMAWGGWSIAVWVFMIADWSVVSQNLRLLLAGRYPVALLWRVWLSLAMGLAITGLSWGNLSQGKLWTKQTVIYLGIITLGAVVISLPGGLGATLKVFGLLLLVVVSSLAGKGLRSITQKRQWIFALVWVLTYGVILWLLQGGLGLETVPLDDLSGLILTLLTASISIVLSFPFGILLALGRQSSLPIIRGLAIAYIELIRGLPLIGILFMAQVMLPLVLPMGVRPDRVIRAIAGFTIFSAAYLAENVRGGLQSIPQGQQEAARALGLNIFQTLGLIVLPQALRTVVPAIIGQFISLFKDTSLLAIASLVDLLGMAQLILGNPKFAGDYAELYLFVASIYGGCCFAMAQASRRLEVKET